MSGFRGPGGGGGGSGGGRTGRSPMGLFVNGAWHCDCNPRLPAVNFKVKKKGPNQGRWFYTCQKGREDQSKCNFFLWADDARPREAAALATNTRTEPERGKPSTPSRRQPSPPPPYTIETVAAGPSRKRPRPEDEYGLEQANEDFDNELSNVMTAVETPSKAIKTSEFATPSTRRRLPWQMDQPSTTDHHGLQTPQTGGRPSINPFNTRLTTPGGALNTPLRFRDEDEETQQTATPSSSFETPTPSRFRNVSAEDLVRDVFGLLQDSNVRLPSDTEAELRGLLSKHAKSAEGLRRGRDVIRTTVKAKDAKINEFAYRVSTLEAELEAEKEMVKHLQWELGAQSDL